MRELYAALGPFNKLGGDVFGDKYNLRAPPNQLVLRRIWPSSNQRKNRRAIRRRDRHPALTGLQPCIERQMKSQLLQIESQAAVLVANVDVDAVHPQIRVGPSPRGEATHAANYKSEPHLNRIGISNPSACPLCPDLWGRLR